MAPFFDRQTIFTLKNAHRDRKIACHRQFLSTDTYRGTIAENIKYRAFWNRLNSSVLHVTEPTVHPPLNIDYHTHRIQIAEAHAKPYVPVLVILYNCTGMVIHCTSGMYFDVSFSKIVLSEEV